MSNKIKNIIEVIGVAVSVLILILLLFILVLYVGLKFNLLKDHPAVIAGLSAALIAFLGVVVSQLWQSSNTNKNIKSAQENLDKQLSHQMETFSQQISFQEKQLKMQHQNALDLKELELNANEKQKLLDEFEEDKKDVYFNAIEFKVHLMDLILMKSALCRTQGKLDIVMKLNGNGEYNELVETFMKQHKEYSEKHAVVFEKYNKSYSILTYTVDTKIIAQASFNIFKNDLHIITEKCNDFRELLKRNDEISIEVDADIQRAIENFDFKVADVTNEIFALYNSDGFKNSYQTFIQDIKKQKIN